MDLRSTRYADVVVLRPAGRIDHHNAPEFSKAVTPHLEQCKAGGDQVLFDLSELEYISSAGLRVFMIAMKQAAAGKGTIAFADPTEMVLEILTVGRITSLVTMYPSVQTAVSLMSPRAGAAMASSGSGS